MRPQRPHGPCRHLPISARASAPARSRCCRLEPSATPGDLLAEDRYALALNQRVFPNLAPPSKRVDLARLQRCFLGPMSIDPLRDLPGIGYELYFDGARLNGPDAALYSRAQAKANCEKNSARYPRIRVACRYNGSRL